MKIQDSDGYGPSNEENYEKKYCTSLSLTSGDDNNIQNYIIIFASTFYLVKSQFFNIIPSNAILGLTM